MAAVIAKKNGLSFVVVGDFGYMANMQGANKLWDEIATMKANAVPDSIEDFSLFVTVGDNLYPKDAENPT